MIQIYSVNQCSKWDEIVKSFEDYDIYYLSGYVRGFELHGDGIPQLLYYKHNDLRAIHVYMKRETAIRGLFDSIRPYGYGGILFEGDISEDNLNTFWDEYLHVMEDENIVDCFVRYHPVLDNALQMKSLCEVIEMGKTVVFDLASPEVIWQNIMPKNRNKIRKAEKNNIEIHHSADWALFEHFIKIYNATMGKDNAEEYYYFKTDFYKSIYEDLAGHYEIFYAKYEGKIIAMSIMLFANKQMHYHLSGSLLEYRNLAPSNLLLYKAAEWGSKNGYKTLHLGGGLGSNEDNLYNFKASFNKESDYKFSVSKIIFNQEKYNALVEECASRDAEFNRESKFFPLYRS